MYGLGHWEARVPFIRDLFHTRSHLLYFASFYFKFVVCFVVCDIIFPSFGLFFLYFFIVVVCHFNSPVVLFKLFCCENDVVCFVF